jgi:hypothetical protein
MLMPFAIIFRHMDPTVLPVMSIISLFRRLLLTPGMFVFWRSITFENTLKKILLQTNHPGIYFQLVK